MYLFSYEVWNDSLSIIDSMALIQFNMFSYKQKFRL